MITNAVSLDPATAKISVHPVSIIVTDRALICMVPPTEDFQPARLLLQKEQALADGGVEVGLQILLTAVINTYESALQFLEDASDAAGRRLVRGAAAEQARAAARLPAAHRPVPAAPADRPDAGGDERHPGQPGTGSQGQDRQDHIRIARHWTIIAEQLTRVANAADALREAWSSVFDTSLALADVRMNQIMKKLTGWAAIIAVPTLVTSFVGMNVGFPAAGTVSGFWLYC